MRLLKCTPDGPLSVTRDFTGNVPPYAILSHTWAGPDAELTLAELAVHQTDHKPDPFAKLCFLAKRALTDRLEYAWMDTCCIDRTSSSELEEAVRSMYRWYQGSAKCYVYLSDVESRNLQPSEAWLKSFRSSRYWTRGWTLQELIAPQHVEFFTRDRSYLAARPR